MEDRNNIKNIIPLATLIAGFFIYVAADQGLFSKLEWPSFLKNKSLPTQSDLVKEQQEKTLKEATSELGDLKASSSKSKEKLSTLLNELDHIDRQVKAGQEKLKQIQKKIELASKLSVEKSKPRKLADRGPQASPEFNAKNWNELIDHITGLTKGHGKFAFSEADGKKSVVMSQNKLWHGKNIYLRPIGIRVAQTLSAHFKQFGVNKITIPFSSEINLAKQRAEVLATYFRELNSEEIEIHVAEVEASAIQGLQGLDVVMELRN